MTTTANILPEIAQQAEQLTKIRQHLHSIPEIAYQEFKTADYINSRLQQWGIKTVRGLATTGVIGILSRGSSSAKIGLRADMDALPILEDNAFTHASSHKGLMHACGHDGHCTMLLGAAEYLAKHSQFDGTIYLIFQPAEEGAAGALKMLEEGLLEQFPMQAIFGMHNIPNIPAGTFASSATAVLASNSEFHLRITGKGGHAAMPHLCIDPIVIAAQLVQALQTIVARNISPLDSAVVSVTKIRAGDNNNVIANNCDLYGTVRAYSLETEQLIKQRMQQLSQGICHSFGASAELNFLSNYPPTINHPAETEFMRQALTEVVGAERVITQTPIMAAEDFAYFLQKIPGSYCFIGNGDGSHRAAQHSQLVPTLHSAGYDFNDAILAIGASAYVKIAETWLAAKS